MKRFFIIMLVSYALLALMLIVFLVLQNRAFAARLHQITRPTSEDSTVYDVSIGDAPTLGPDNAPVKLVVFADFQCPACVHGFRSALKLTREHPEKIQLVFKHFPLSFHSQAELGPDLFNAIAVDLGLDLEFFERDLKEADWRSVIAEDLAVARVLKVGGAPTFFVNGVKLVNPDYDMLKQRFLSAVSVK